jgi:curli biogenesis system outer membrane secretion channel CsgG
MDYMRKTWLGVVVAVAGIVLSGCTPPGGQTASGPAPATGASARANAAASTAQYQSVNYVNASTKGPAIIVLPGEVKSNNATFAQRYLPNNIADYAELELSQANFQVLDRANLGSVLREIELAHNLGDPARANALFQKGALQSTRWIIKFDVLRAEKVAEASGGFSGNTIGNIAGTIIGGRTGSVVNQGTGSVQTAEAAGVWIVGMRYKVIDARTTQQVTQGYAEERMEVGSTGVSVFGVSSRQAGQTTLDSLVIRLVQKNVAEIDQRYK